MEQLVYLEYWGDDAGVPIREGTLPPGSSM
jgi:hypothetical protein